MSKNVEVIDLNSYVTRRTTTSGALGTGLLFSNINQFATILIKNDKSSIEIAQCWLLSTTMILQVIL